MRQTRTPKRIKNARRKARAATARGDERTARDLARYINRATAQEA